MPSVASFNPATFVQGGLFNNVNVRIVKARTAYLNYGSGHNTGNPIPGVIIAFQDITSGEIYQDALYSAGQKLIPSQDGRFLGSNEDGAAVGTQTNLGAFIQSLAKVGVPIPLLQDGDASKLVGLEIHVSRVKASTLTGRTPEAGQKDSEIAIATKLLRLPGEGSAPQFTGAPAAAPAPAAPATPPWAPAPAAPPAPAPAPAPAAPAAPAATASVSADTVSKLGAFIREVMNGQPSMPAASASSSVFMKLMGDNAIPLQEKQAAMQFITNPSFLATIGLRTDGVNILV